MTHAVDLMTMTDARSKAVEFTNLYNEGEDSIERFRLNILNLVLLTAREDDELEYAAEEMNKRVDRFKADPEANRHSLNPNSSGSIAWFFDEDGVESEEDEEALRTIKRNIEYEDR